MSRLRDPQALDCALAVVAAGASMWLWARILGVPHA